MNALPISDKDFSVVVNKFDKLGLGYVKRVGNSIRINTYNSFISDERNNTVEFALYLHENGYCWRRYIYGDHKPACYQMFRTVRNRKWNTKGWYETTDNTYYVWKHFTTIEEAIICFEQHAIKHSKYFYFND